MRTTPPDRDPRDPAPASATRVLLLALLFAATALTLPAVNDSVVENARAQLDDCGTLPVVMECAFEISVEMEGSGTPGSILNGTLTITNTGDGMDSYAIDISTDNETWTGEVEPVEHEDVEAEDSVDVEILVRVPPEARVDAASTFTLNVTSQNDEDLWEVDTFDVTATQLYAWILVCDDEVTIQKGQQGSVMLTARNTGNGPDQATITSPPLPEGINIDPINDFDVAPGALADQNVTIAIGIALEEGNYTIDWDLESQGDAGATDRCSTTLNAVVDGGGNGGDDPEEEDGPLPVAIVLIAALAAAVAARRRREKNA